MRRLWERLEAAKDVNELRNIACDFAQENGADVAFMLRLVDSIEHAAKLRLAADVRKQVDGALFFNGVRDGA